MPRPHFEDEVEERRLLPQLPAIVGAVGEKMLDPWPADRLEDHLHSGAVGDVGRREIDNQQPPIGVDRALTPGHLPGRIMASLGVQRRCFEGLAFDNTGARAGFAPAPLAIEHPGDVADHVKQRQLYKTSGPPVDRLPGRKVLRYLTAAARTRHVADHVENLAQVDSKPTARLAGFCSNRAIRSHYSSVRSIGQRFVSSRAIGPRVARVHIHSQ